MAMYPTPNAWDSARGPVSEDYIKKNPTTQITLVTRVKQEQRRGMYPTPVAKDNCTESLETWEKRAKKHKEQGKTIPQALRIKVQEEAKMYPTPTTQDSNKATKRWREDRQNNLTAAVFNPNKVKKIYNTPTTSDHKNTSFPKSQKNRDSIVGDLMREKNPPKVGGRLNPNFVEFLMGYPTNWTKVE
tara:strand:- start:216 stop:776 length:561 start_codon:yes stop_codon:yes gene_type:complete